MNTETGGMLTTSRVLIALCLGASSLCLAPRASALPIGVPGPPVHASAGFAVKDGHGGAYLATFALLQNLAGAKGNPELISVVVDCGDEDCPTVSRQVDVLPAGAVRTSQDGHTITVKTTFASRPLTISWSVGSITQTGTTLNVFSADGTYHTTFLRYVIKDARVVVSALGTTCRAGVTNIGTIYSGDAGSAVDATANDGSAPRADQVRELKTLKGVCFNH